MSIHVDLTIKNVGRPAPAEPRVQVSTTTRIILFGEFRRRSGGFSADDRRDVSFDMQVLPMALGVCTHDDYIGRDSDNVRSRKGRRRFLCRDRKPADFSFRTTVWNSGKVTSASRSRFPGNVYNTGLTTNLQCKCSIAVRADRCFGVSWQFGAAAVADRNHVGLCHERQARKIPVTTTATCVFTYERRIRRADTIRRSTSRE